MSRTHEQDDCGSDISSITCRFRIINFVSLRTISVEIPEMTKDFLDILEHKPLVMEVWIKQKEGREKTFIQPITVKEPQKGN